MITNTSITSQGQVTIPVEIRRMLNLQPGDKVAFFINEDKQVIVEPAKSFLDLRGSIKSKKKYSDKAADAAIARRFAEKGEDA